VGQIDEEKEYRVPVTGEETFICLIYCMNDGLISYRAPVDKDELMGFHVSEIITFRHIRNHLDPGCFSTCLRQAIEKFLSVDLHDAFSRPRRERDVHVFPVVGNKPEAYIPVR
jgi:hypothetical protein